MDGTPARWREKSEKHADSILITFPNGDDTFNTINSSQYPSVLRPGTSNVDVVELDDLLPVPPSPKLLLAWGGRKLARLEGGGGYSDDQSWHAALGVHIPGLDPARPDEARTPATSMEIFLTNLAIPRDDGMATTVSSLGHGRIRVRFYANGRELSQMTPTIYHINTTRDPLRCVASVSWVGGEQTAVASISLEWLLNAISSLPTLEQQKEPITMLLTFAYSIRTTRRLPLGLLPSLPLDLITHDLNLFDIYHLGQAIPSLHPHTNGVASSRIRTVLHPYFDSLAAFDKVLRQTGSIIGGSIILSILRPGNWRPGDIDVVVPDVGYAGLDRFLLKSGYALVPNEEPDEDYPGGLRFQFRHRRYEKGTLSVDVCQVSHVSAVDFILTYHSTSVMNFYRPGEIVCLFPKYTFKGLYQENHFTPTDRLDAALAKYHQRGYNPTEPKYIQDSRVAPEGALVMEGEDTGLWMLRRKDLGHEVFRVHANLSG